MKTSIYFQKWKSSLCDLYFYADDKNLIALTFRPTHSYVTKNLKDAEIIETSSPVIKKAMAELEEYFQGKRRSFTVPLKLYGTDFQKKAWTELSKIPFGKTISYQDQAKKIKSEKAVRAVGSANGKNPIAIIIPCHRVIASSGKLSGFGGGVHIKEKLLQLEGLQVLK